MPKPPKPSGFTLIELLIVVAIIAILAAIAIPNLLEAQTRSKVSRCHSDMRAIATGLEAYVVDWNTYPADFMHGYSQLSSPIAYITSAPHNAFPFLPSLSQDSYELGTGHPGLKPPAAEPSTWPNTWWLLASNGPDGLDDTLDVYSFPETYSACPYDPTNGSVSKGDIYRLSRAHPNFVTDANPYQGQGNLH